MWRPACEAAEQRHCSTFGDKLRAQGQVISENEIRQLSPLIHRHTNMPGRFHFELTTESMFVISDTGLVATTGSPSTGPA